MNELSLRYIYCSSAGVYLKSDLLPHCEVWPYIHHPHAMPIEIKKATLSRSNEHSWLSFVADRPTPWTQRAGTRESWRRRACCLPRVAWTGTSIRLVYIYGLLNYNPVEEFPPAQGRPPHPHSRRRQPDHQSSSAMSRSEKRRAGVVLHVSEAVTQLRPCIKFFTPLPQMFRHIHRVLNIYEKIINYIDCDKFTRRIC
jgi:hypothetical protein